MKCFSFYLNLNIWLWYDVYIKIRRTTVVNKISVYCYQGHWYVEFFVIFIVIFIACVFVLDEEKLAIFWVFVVLLIFLQYISQKVVVPQVLFAFIKRISTNLYCHFGICETVLCIFCYVQRIGKANRLNRF